MEVFNLAEELEKERKKNKELEEELEKEKQYKKFYENMYLASEDTNKQFRKMSKHLINRIDKAINYIENTDTFQIVHSTDELAEMLREKTKKELLDILRGNNE